MDGSKDHEHQVNVGVAETANLFLRRELFDRIGGFEASHPGVRRLRVRRAMLSPAERGLSMRRTPSLPIQSRTSGRTLLRALWKYNRGYAVHAARAGEIPEGVKLRSWVPIVQTYRARRRWGRSVGPDRRWLSSNGVEPRPGEVVAATAIMYLLLPYQACAAQLAGWFEGRRLRREFDGRESER